MSKDFPVTAPYALSIPTARRTECLHLLARCDAHGLWDASAVRPYEQHLIALVYCLAAPRIRDVRGGEAAAKMLPVALSVSGGSVD